MDLPKVPVDGKTRIRQKGPHHTEPPLRKKPCRADDDFVFDDAYVPEHVADKQEPQSVFVSDGTGDTGVGKSTPGVCTAETGT